MPLPNISHSSGRVHGYRSSFCMGCGDIPAVNRRARNPFGWGMTMTDLNEASITVDAQNARDSASAGDSFSGNVAVINRTSGVSVAHGNAAGLSGEGGALISMIERASRDPSVDIDKFERLLKMQQLVASQANERAFNAAIASAKGEIGPVAKNKTVDFTTQKGRTNYKHEDLAEVARTVDKVLSHNGLSYRYRTTQEGGKLTVSCILTHVDGHSETTTLSAPNDQSGNKNDIQAIGSAATYLQRYTLKLALGLAASVDDDGKAAGKQEQAVTITAKQAKTIREGLEFKGLTEERFCKKYQIKELEDLPAKAFDSANKAIADHVNGN